MDNDEPVAGAEAGLRQLFEQHWTGLCRLGFLMLGDPAAAEECVQDAYLGVFRAWDRVSLMERPDLYLRTAVLNQCRSRLRRRQVEARVARASVAGAGGGDPGTRRPGAGGDDGSGTGKGLADPDLVRQEIVAAVRRLPPRQRAAVVLRYYEDRSEAEIASAMGCSPGTVKSQLAKARATLGRDLAGYMEDDG